MTPQERFDNANEEYKFCERMHQQYRITDRLTIAYRELKDAREALQRVQTNPIQIIVA